MRIRIFIIAVGLIALAACSSGNNLPAPAPNSTPQTAALTSTPVPSPTRTPFVIPRDPTPSATATAVPVPVMTRVNTMSAGEVNTCAILSNGKLKCWGGNFAGQLGQGHRDFIGDQPKEMGSELMPIDLGAGRTVTQVAVGSRHVCALLDDENVKCWGNNEFGQLGRNTGADPSNAEIGDSRGEMGSSVRPVDFGGDNRAVQISSGEDHTCALLDNGTVQCWGRNDKGQLGIGSTDNVGDDPDEMGENLRPVELGTQRVPVYVSAGDKHNCALFRDNTVTCWGESSNRRLGMNIRINVGTSEDHTGGIFPTVELESPEPPVQLSMGGRHSCALLDGGSIECWGSANVTGRVAANLGLSFVQIEAGREFACGLFSDGKVLCWGENKSGQLGQGTSEELVPLSSASIVDLGSGARVVELAAGDDHMCARLEDDSIKCWGSNTRGQLGQGHRVDVGKSPDDMGANLKPIDLG